MSFFKPCGSCNRVKFYIKKRSYMMPKIDPKRPITSKNELCRSCFDTIKKLTLN